MESNRGRGQGSLWTVALTEEEEEKKWRRRKKKKNSFI
jgi:hypothetical protein